MESILIPLASTNATIFYIVGGVTAALALIVSAIGVKSPDFPGNNKTAVAVVALFTFFVIGSGAYAILTARDEQQERREHLAEAEGHGNKEDEESTAGAEQGVPVEEEPAEEEPAEEEPAGDATELTLVADPAGALEYDTDSLSADAGRVLIAFDNPSPIPHDVDLELEEDVVVDSEVITEDSVTIDTDLVAGTYTFFCSVAGHREAGMEGTLEVK